MTESKKRLQKDIAWVVNNLSLPGWEWDEVFEERPVELPFEQPEIKLINPSKGEILFRSSSVGVNVYFISIEGHVESKVYSTPQEINLGDFNLNEEVETNNMKIEKAFRIPGTDIILKEGTEIEIIEKEEETEPKPRSSFKEFSEEMELMTPREITDVIKTASLDYVALNKGKQELAAIDKPTVKDYSGYWVFRSGMGSITVWKRDVGRAFMDDMGFLTMETGDLSIEMMML